MAGYQTRVAGHYRPDGFYVPISYTQKYYLNVNGVYDEVTPFNYQTNLYLPDTYIGVYENNLMTWLPAGTRVYVETQWFPIGPDQTLRDAKVGEKCEPTVGGQIPMDLDWSMGPLPKPKPVPGYQTRVAGHYRPDGFYVPISYTQKYYLNVNGVYDEVTPFNYQTNLYLPDTYIGIYENNLMTWLPAGTRVYVETQWFPIGPDQTLRDAKVGEKFEPTVGGQIPMDLDWYSKPTHGPPPLPLIGESFNLDPALSLRTSKMRPRKCTECGAMVLTFSRIFGNVVCYECAMNKLCEGRLSSMKNGAEITWTAQVVFDLYSELSYITDEAMRARLPPAIPLPLDSFVCPVRNEACAVGYPAEGHFAGLSAKVAEGGCPNGHAICKGCATKLTTCPKCKSFVPYLELPLGCPACPGDYNHCANFKEACNVPGCTGGTWPLKPRPEEAKVEEPKVQPRAGEAKGEPTAVEEPPKQKAEVKVEEQPPTV